jgi:aspartyl protease family protein
MNDVVEPPEPSSKLKITIVWLLVGLAVYLGISWYEASKLKTVVNVSANGIKSLEIERSRDAHYHVLAKINGEPIEFMLDTGATSTAISAQTARKLGLSLSNPQTVSTANGPATAYQARVKLELPGGLIQIDNLRVGVLDNLGGTALLGMDVLGRLQLLQKDNRLVMSSGAGG